MVRQSTIPAAFAQEVTERLRENKRVRRSLPIWGRVHMDRQLPFLCVYRRPTRRKDEGTERLITGQPAYLMATGHKSTEAGLSKLVSGIVETMTAVFGSFLIIEIWSEETSSANPNDPAIEQPAFRIVVPKSNGLGNTIEVLQGELANIRIHRKQAQVELVSREKIAPPRLPALVSPEMAKNTNCISIGIVVRPIYRDSATKEILPLVHEALTRAFNLALQRSVFAFARTQTKYHPPHYHMLGRRAMVKAVWDVDKQLATISNSFDFLLQVTPINTYAAWRRFKRGRFERTPIFHYRPHVVDPALLKRQLWNIRIEKLEDPTIQHLFRTKRVELDTQISMLSSMNSRKFFYGSMQLYGHLSDALIESAGELLEKISPYSRESKGGRTMNAQAFAELARAEILQYQQESADFKAKVLIQQNFTGLMVSQGNVLIGDTLKIAGSRAEALINHEVGTHIVTYYNGQSQPFQLLRSGLAGYEEFQEGLAVFAEYLVGGLSKPRLRLLAGRVMAAHSLIQGASFIETFRLLTETYRFEQYTAFTITTRVYRAGGLTKDAIYLRGLIQLLRILQKEPLNELFFVGKIAMEHIPIIQELQRRRVLHKPAIRPHYLNAPQTASRLERVSRGISVIELIER